MPRPTYIKKRRFRGLVVILCIAGGATAAYAAVSASGLPW
jgi:hypothetical protein